MARPRKPISELSPSGLRERRRQDREKHLIVAAVNDRFVDELVRLGVAAEDDLTYPGSAQTQEAVGAFLVELLAKAGVSGATDMPPDFVS